MILLCSCLPKTLAQSSWAQVKKAKKGTAIINWYESQPFIFKDDSGKMRGIEVEILLGFKKYLKDFYQTDLEIAWQEGRNFGDTYASISKPSSKATFGVSAFSITPERKVEVNFSPPYLTDICVIISSQNIPIAKNQQEFKKLFSGMTAVTIRKTTYEQDLLKLKNIENIPFSMTYIPSSENVLYVIASMDSAFGFIDLPVYMKIFNENPSVNVRRQNFFPSMREGYGIISPKGSDWSEILKEYFNNKNFKTDLEKIISHYMDSDLHHFVENLARQSGNTQTALLTKEKEIQSKDLEQKSKEIEREAFTNQILIGLIAVVLASLVVIIVLYKKQNEQKKKIEVQQQSIELKNQELEKRNQRLVALDEEKNNLIKILAHDLRTPIGHVYGLAEVFLLDNPDLTENNKVILNQIVDASVRLNKMISSLLDIDAIENDRVTIQNEVVTISELVAQVSKSFEKQAKKKDIEIEFKTQSDQLAIKGDPLFLTQVFENLISNAIKFSERETKIEITVSTKDEKILINIRDQGPGLTPEDLGLIFKKYQRLSAKPTDGEKSLGLGLSIVKKYVELMGGLVQCQSQIGQGAEFIVIFDKLEKVK